MIIICCQRNDCLITYSRSEILHILSQLNFWPKFIEDLCVVLLFWFLKHMLKVFFVIYLNTKGISRYSHWEKIVFEPKPKDLYWKVHLAVLRPSGTCFSITNMSVSLCEIYKLTQTIANVKVPLANSSYHTILYIRRVTII